MKTVLSRKDLKYCLDKFVYVKRENGMYVRTGDEYVKKRYFDVDEASTTLGITRDKVHQYCRKLGIQAPANKRRKIRITLAQMQRMADEQTKIQE